MVADSHTCDPFPEPDANPPRIQWPPDETAFLLRWNDDIERSSHSAARRAVGTAVDADDLAQDAHVRILEVFREFPNVPEAYVRTVIAHSMASTLRSEGRSIGTHGSRTDEFTDLPAPGIEPDDPWATRALSILWLVSLPQRRQDVVRHLYVEGHSQRETAALMELSQPRVAQLHRRLLADGRRDLIQLAHAA